MRASRRGVWISGGIRFGVRALGAGSLVAGLGVGSSVLGSSAAGAAPAPNLSCGQVVTVSTTLTGTLTCRSYFGSADLTVGASGVTLNLGGHTIFSHDTFELGGVGVRVQGESNVTVENGTIATAFEGVSATSDTQLTVTKVRLVAQGTYYFYDYGMSLYNVAHASITDNTATGESRGFSGSTISTSTISGNTASTGSPYSYGFFLGNLTRDTIVQNVANHSYFVGFYLYGHLTTDTVSANRANYDGNYGLYGATGTRPRGINIDIGDPNHCYTVLCIIPGHGGGTIGELVPPSQQGPRFRG